MTSSSARQILRDTLGYTLFRGAQQAIVEHVAAGGDALMQDQVEALKARYGDEFLKVVEDVSNGVGNWPQACCGGPAFSQQILAVPNYREGYIFLTGHHGPPRSSH